MNDKIGMTVEELIVELERLPRNATVWKDDWYINGVRHVSGVNEEGQKVDRVYII